MPMTAQMASESRLRTTKWLQNGCNGFHMKNPVSNPMSFWVEQDVLEYIYTYHIPIADVYGKVLAESGADRQKAREDTAGMGIFDAGKPVYQTDADALAAFYAALDAIWKNPRTDGKLWKGCPTRRS